MKTHTLTIEGNTKSDIAYEMWNNMNPMERFEIMQKVEDSKNISKKYQACLSYIADNMV